MPAVLSLLVFVVAVEPVVVFAEQGAFATVFVVDEGPLRYLRFDSALGDDQSVIDRRDARRVPMDYIRVAAAGLAFDDDEGRALVIGLGGGAFPMMLRRAKPAYTIDAVDVDPLVLEVARDFFAVVPDHKLTLITEDGARFLKQTNHRYDLAFIDAYSGDGIPPHLATPAFFRALRGRLAEGGLAVLNIAVDERSTERRLLRSFGSAFPVCARLVGATPDNVIVLGVGSGIPAPAEPGRLSGGIALAEPTASHPGGALSASQVRSALRHFDAHKRLPFALERVVESIGGCT